jgi:hypothetical protein
MPLPKHMEVTPNLGCGGTPNGKKSFPIFGDFYFAMKKNRKKNYLRISLVALHLVAVSCGLDRLRGFSKYAAAVSTSRVHIGKRGGTTVISLSVFMISDMERNKTCQDPEISRVCQVIFLASQAFS